ncbi:hypothetical protein I545_6381 [Mycobacterium kansasii 662]|uniref:Uncharacterized protein n=1 Tax=Mycobacterium kansasii 662 TaxID=1299326 RepID=X7YL05_MYCKA|nr:hypothetical protein I545_6381 [Mycobacterium kansasii 662]
MDTGVRAHDTEQSVTGVEYATTRYLSDPPTTPSPRCCGICAWNFAAHTVAAGRRSLRDCPITLGLRNGRRPISIAVTDQPGASTLPHSS